MKTPFGFVALLVLVWAPCADADVILTFDTIRLTQNGTVSRDDGVAVTNTAGTLVENGITDSLTFTVASDFDGDGLDDSFDFDLVLTSVAPPSGAGGVGNLNTNGGGFTGVGNPRIDPGEAIQYSLNSPSSVQLSGTLADAAITFDGFTGGNFSNAAFNPVPSPGVNFTANGEGFNNSGAFELLAAGPPTLTLESFDTAIFPTGVDFQFTVALPATTAAVPEPSSFALLGLGAFMVVLRRRRHEALQIKKQ